MGKHVSRKVELHLERPLRAQRWGTNECERTSGDDLGNPYTWEVYDRRRGFSQIIDPFIHLIRCNGQCGELKEATRYNFEPDTRNKSGFRHTCRDCVASSRRGYRNDYMRDYRRKRREQKSA